MKTKNLYTIKFVADRTGLKPHLIRAWESRYGAVIPKRTQTNRRLYCQDDILRLRILKAALAHGHQISHIAGMNLTELKELLGELHPETPAPLQPTEASKNEKHSEDYYLKACIKAVVDLDPDNLTSLLTNAAVHLTRKQWIEALIVPLFREIGELWARGELKIINEHMASNTARVIMWDMLRSVELAPGAPQIILGTPVGQWHEMGALAAALASTEAGWRPVYVGVNLPAEELALAMGRFNAMCVGLSITHCLDDTRIQPELLKLRRYIGPDPCILVGGLRGAEWDHLIRQIQAKRIKSWQEVTRMLSYLAMDGGVGHS